jgi:hypothetical protein
MIPRERDPDATSIAAGGRADNPSSAVLGRRRGDAVLWFAVVFGAAIAVGAVGRATRNEALALGGGYGVIFFGIGGAPFQLHADLDLYARLTGAILVGFSVLLVVGALMADIRGLWDPTAAAVVVGVAAIVLHGIGLARIRGLLRVRSGGGLRERDFRARVAADSRPRGPSDRRRGSIGRGSVIYLRHLSLMVTVLGTALWLAPALWTHDRHPGYWGMLSTLGPLWYAGLVLVLVGFAIGRRTELSAAAATLSFGLATTLTPALVYAAPRNETAGKQMQFTEYVLTHHHVDVTSGIYTAFSATFSGVAALSELMGVHGMLGGMSLFGLATFWPVLLVFMRVAELRLLAGRLLATTSRRWCAVMLVLLVDSLGEDYFSPQSIGYVLAIGAVAIAVKGVTPRPLGRRSTLMLLTLVGLALGPTHELSPYLAAGALFVLACFDQAPWWSCLPVGLPALAWAAVVHNAISQNFSFGSLFDLSNFRPPVTLATPGLHRLAVVGLESHALLIALLILIALGAVGLSTNKRAKSAWAYALCPIVGLMFIAINPYGNEGIFRAAVFAIPWMAILAMTMPNPRNMSSLFMRPFAVTIGVVVCLIALLGTFIVAAYAMDGTNVLPRANVAIVAHLMRLPRRDAFVLTIGSANNPADSASFATNYTTLEWSQVARGAPELQRLHPPSVDATVLADRYALVASQNGGVSSSPMYVIWAHSSLMYSQAYGLQSPAEMSAWLRLLKRSPNWRPVDRDGGVYLFERR